MSASNLQRNLPLTSNTYIEIRAKARKAKRTHLNALVVPVDHSELAGGGQANAAHLFLQLPVAAAFRSDNSHEAAVALEHLHSCVVVAYEDQALLAVDGDAIRS